MMNFKLYFIILLQYSLCNCRPSLLNPNSVARPSVTYGRDHSPLEKDLAAIFNKVAHGSTAAPPLSTTHIPTTTLLPSSTVIPSTTTTPLTQLTAQPDTPEYVSRPRFKPPLPPEYTNPFADKAILRGSQSEGPASGSRRPLPPPPPPPVRPPPGVELIPIRPPDLNGSDRKKPLNTPAAGIDTGIHHRHHDHNGINKNESTSESIIPIIQSPAVTRILSENSNRPTNDDDRRHNSSSRVLLDLVNKDSIVDIQTPPTSGPINNNNNNNNNDNEQSPKDQQDTSPHVVTDPPPVPEWPIQIGGITWDVIIYTLASLFALLAIYSFIICPFRAADSLIPKGCYVFLHVFLFFIGLLRAAYLFYDPYNIRGSFPSLLDYILLDSVFPCLFSAFAILFYALANITKVQLCDSRAQSPTVLSFVIIINIAIFIAFQWAAQTLDLINFLISALRALPLLSIISIIFAFLIAFRCIYRAARRLQGDVLRANFAKMGALPRRPQLKLASRLILTSSILILVLCGLQLYILFAYYHDNKDNNIYKKPIAWWSLQLSARILELVICFILAAVAWLRRTGVPTKFSPCCCVVSSINENKSVEDMFPAICSKNNAIHNYSLHTGKTVYENNTLKSTTATTNNTGNQSPYITQPTNTMPLGSLKRGVVGKCGTLPSNRLIETRQAQQQQQQQHNNYNNKKSSSMLFSEDGIVRFRTTDDPEQHMQDVLHRSLNRYKHEGLTSFNMSSFDAGDNRRYNSNTRRSGSLGELNREFDEYSTRSMGRKKQKRHHYHHHPPPPPPPPPESPEHSSLSGCSSSDLSESDLTSAGYERVRSSQQQQQQRNIRSLRYKTSS